MWDLIFLTRDRTHAPCIGRQSFNHWATKEVLDENIFTIQVFLFLNFFIILFYFLTLQYCIGFAIYQHDSAMRQQKRH